MQGLNFFNVQNLKCSRHQFLMERTSIYFKIMLDYDIIVKNEFLEQTKGELI